MDTMERNLDRAHHRRHRLRGRALTAAETRALIRGLTTAKAHAAHLFDGEPLLRLMPSERKRAA